MDKAMFGEINLDVLISSMDAELHESIYVFCTVNSEIIDMVTYNPWAIIHEKEGITLIVLEKIAKENNWTYEGQFKCITLNVHSSLAAVGLTAAIASELAKNDISANVVAGYYHDHIFVQENVANKALEILKELSNRKQTTASAVKTR